MGLRGEGATGLLKGPSAWELLITVLGKGLAVEENLKEEEEEEGIDEDEQEEEEEEEEQDGEDEEDGILMYGNELATDILPLPYKSCFSLSFVFFFFPVNFDLGFVGLFCLVLVGFGGFAMCYRNHRRERVREREIR